MKPLINLFLIFIVGQCFSHSINEARFDIYRGNDELYIKVVAPTDAILAVVRTNYPDVEFESIQDSRFKECGFEYFKSTINLWNGREEITLKGNSSKVTDHISVFEFRTHFVGGKKDTLVSIAIASFLGTFEDQLNVVVYRDSKQLFRHRLQPDTPVRLNLTSGVFTDFKQFPIKRREPKLWLFVLYGLSLAVILMLYFIISKQRLPNNRDNPV